MSDTATIEGLTKKTADLQELMNETIRTLKALPSSMADVFSAASGDKDALKKFFSNISKIQKEEITKKSLERFEGDFDKMLEYLEALRNDSKYNREQDELTRKQAKAQYKLQSGKQGFMQVFDQMIKGNAFFQAVSGRHPNSPGSQYERFEDQKRSLQSGGQLASERNRANFDRNFFGSPSSPKGGGGGQGDDYDLPYLRAPHAASQDFIQSLQRGGRGRGGGGGGYEKYGVGKSSVTASEVAKLPFALSAPPILLHSDLVNIYDILKETNEDAEWASAGKSGSGGGGIESFLGGAAVQALGKALPAILAVALPLLGTAAITLGFISLMSSINAKGKADTAKKFATLSAVDQARLKAQGLENDYSAIMLSPSYSGEGAGKPSTQQDKINEAKINLKTTGTPESHKAAYDLLGFFDVGSRTITQSLLGNPLLRTSGLPEGYNWGDLPKDIKLKLMRSVPEFDQAGDNPEDYKNFLSMFKNTGKKFGGGGVIPETGLFGGHKGEIVFNPQESGALRRDIQSLVDKASGTKPDQSITDLRKELEELIQLQKDMIELTKAGNSLLTKDESKLKEPKKEYIPPSQLKVK